MLGAKRTGKRGKDLHNKQNQVDKSKVRCELEKRAKDSLQRLSELDDGMGRPITSPNQRWNNEQLTAWNEMASKVERSKPASRPNTVKSELVGSARRRLSAAKPTVPIPSDEGIEKIESIELINHENFEAAGSNAPLESTLQFSQMTEPMEEMMITTALHPSWHRSILSESNKICTKPSKPKDQSRSTKVELAFFKQANSIRQRILESLNLEKRVVCLQPASSSTQVHVLHSRPRTSKPIVKPQSSTYRPSSRPMKSTSTEHKKKDGQILATSSYTNRYGTNPLSDKLFQNYKEVLCRLSHTIQF